MPKQSTVKKPSKQSAQLRTATAKKKSTVKSTTKSAKRGAALPASSTLADDLAAIRRRRFTA
jgi:hypothetical protein